jgi:hypothetical protein
MALHRVHSFFFTYVQETHLREALRVEAAIPTPDIKIVPGWDSEVDPFPFWQPHTWYIRSAGMIPANGPLVRLCFRS